MSWPFKLSVITINLNNAAGLAQTIQSVIQQKFSSLEYILIDGGSDDNSQQVIGQYSQSIHYSISEKDEGIYHAMNKGIARANGEYILFINSGEVLCANDVLQQLFENGNDADIIYGDIILEDGKISNNVIFPDKITFNFFLENSLPHPCTVIRHKVFDEAGGYMQQYSIAADWALFLLAICRYNFSYQHVPVFVSCFFLGGISSQARYINKIASEKNEVLKKYFPAFLSDYTEHKSAAEELVKTRKFLGYRIHNKLKRLLKL